MTGLETLVQHDAKELMSLLNRVGTQGRRVRPVPPRYSRRR